MSDETCSNQFIVPIQKRLYQPVFVFHDCVGKKSEYASLSRSRPNILVVRTACCGPGNPGSTIKVALVTEIGGETSSKSYRLDFVEPSPLTCEALTVHRFTVGDIPRR